MEILNFFADRDHFLGGIAALIAITIAICSIISTWRDKS